MAAEGDNVEEGSVVIVLEAMKMQNEIKAGIGGRVRKIMCKPGERVEANMPLMEIASTLEGDD
ncbi:MAG: biotin/lipoyl-containing protein [Candidatus Thalassarchaeaceae archaeon]